MHGLLRVYMHGLLRVYMHGLCRVYMHGSGGHSQVQCGLCKCATSSLAKLRFEINVFVSMSSSAMA